MKLRAVFFAGSAAWLLACSDETAAPTVITPGPASIVITSLSPLGNTVWNAPLEGVSDYPEQPGDPQPIELDCDGRLGVTIQTRGVDSTEATNWYYRSPGGCGSTPNCGYVRVELDPQAELTLDSVDLCDNRTGMDGTDGSDGTEATRTSLACRSGAAATLAFDLSAQRDTLAGPHVIRAALFRESRTPARDREGNPLQVTLAVELATPSCDPAGTGGTPNSPGTGGAAGADPSGAGGEGGG